MGMPIDKTIEFFNGLEAHTPQAKDARDMAIDTMRKYQKIEEIIKDHDADKMPEDYWYIDKIREVIKNGNVD